MSGMISKDAENLVSNLQREVSKLGQDIEEAYDNEFCERELHDCFSLDDAYALGLAEGQMLVVQTYKNKKAAQINLNDFGASKRLIDNGIEPLVKLVRERIKNWTEFKIRARHLAKESTDLKRYFEVAITQSKTYKGDELGISRLENEANEINHVLTIPMKTIPIKEITDDNMGHVKTMAVSSIAVNDYIESRQRLFEAETKNGLDGRSNLSLSVYAITTIILYLTDSIFNFIIFFEGIGGTFKLSLVYAIGIAVMFAVSSHFLGYRIKYATVLAEEIRQQNNRIEKEKYGKADELVNRKFMTSFVAVLKQIYWPLSPGILIASSFLLGGFFVLLYTRLGVSSAILETLTGSVVQFKDNGAESLSSNNQDLQTIYMAGKSTPKNATGGIDGDFSWVEMALLFLINIIIIGATTMMSAKYHNVFRGYSQAKADFERCEFRIKTHYEKIAKEINLIFINSANESGMFRQLQTRTGLIQQAISRSEEKVDDSFFDNQVSVLSQYIEKIIKNYLMALKEYLDNQAKINGLIEEVKYKKTGGHSEKIIGFVLPDISNDLEEDIKKIISNNAARLTS